MRNDRHTATTRNRWFVHVRIMIAAAGVVGGLAIAAPGTNAAGASTAKPVTVGLTTKQSPSDGRDYVVVRIRVGGGPSVPVLLDTGSSGLDILSSVVGPKVRSTGQTMPLAYLSGSLTGTLDTGQVQIGGLRTGSSTGFVSIPVKGNQAMVNYFRQKSIDGIMGIGMANGAVLDTDWYSPLLQLPSPYWQGATLRIHQHGAGTLTIGPVTATARRGAIPLAMARATPSTYPHGVPGYQKDATLCWSSNRGKAVCGNTDMDLGSPSPAFTPGVLPGLPTENQVVVKPGSHIAVATPGGTPVWSYVTGRSYPTNLTLLQDQGYTDFNVGINFFFDHTVSYNVAKGQFLVGPTS